MRQVQKILPSAIEAPVLRIAAAQRVLQHWDNVVGEALAERSWPDRYERGVVWVAVQGSAWAQELRLMKELILKRLRTIASDDALFEDVRFGVRKLPERPNPPAAETPSEPEELTIREIAQRRLQRWRDAAPD